MKIAIDAYDAEGKPSYTRLILIEAKTGLNPNFLVNKKSSKNYKFLLLLIE